MKYYPSKKLFLASNVTFSAERIEAYSYSWWKFVAIIDGLVVFNNYRYSTTTSGHQWKVRKLMQDLRIRVDIEAPFREGLQELPKDKPYNLIQDAEERLCEAFLKDEEKKIRRAEKALKRKLNKKIEASNEQKTS
jgi:hypothetical protein